jgi:hypothetical protein
VEVSPPTPPRPGETEMPERRTATKLIRFPPEELARITTRAQACGRTPARFIRESALGAKVDERTGLVAQVTARAILGHCPWHWRETALTAPAEALVRGTNETTL